MSIQPDTLLEVRRIFQQRTGLPAASLGIIHYVDGDGKYRGGGGYHAGNDLLKLIGRESSDYSKRQTALDRPGSNYGSAIDIGRFKVTLPNGRVVTNHDMTRWMLAEIAAGASDTLWIREIIYSLDDRTVQRYDRLGMSSTGDSSHRTHEHFSVFRSMIDSPHIPGLFRRFWAAMEGRATTPAPAAVPVESKEKEAMLITYLFAAATGSKPNRWGMGVVSGGEKFWFESKDQGGGNAYSDAVDTSATTVSDASYEDQKAQFVGQPA